ncbi:MAG: BRO family protein, partial [Clostridium sp.]
MNDLVTRKFKNKYLNSLIWEDEVCWVGVDIVEYFGYTQKRKAINDCIKVEKLKEGKDYKILSGEELKLFKEVFADTLEDIKFAPKIIIFYERGLYRFLAYTKMPLGIEFREWIGNEVMPTLREKGYYVMDGAGKQSKNTDFAHKTFTSNYSKFSTEQMERYRIAFETAKMFETSIDKITKDPVYKFLC